jgi:Spy/CpxP family protein refolding chaperone
MRRFTAVAALSLLLAVPTFGQSPTAPAPDGMRRFQPPPDHWMTIDSLSQALNLTAAQRTKVSQVYDSLNAVMKAAAVRRQAFRQEMQGAFQPGQEPSPEMRARMDSARTQMQQFQTEADKWIASIRANLTADQQTKFDSLPKPQVARRPPSGAMGGGPTRP